MKYLIKFILILTASFSLCGQKVYTVEDILSNHLYQENKNIHKVLKSASKNASNIEKYEFRSETNQWDSERQEYTFRASLRSAKEKAAEQEIWNTWSKLISMEDQQFFIEQLHKKYEYITELKYLSDQIIVNKNLLAVLSDQTKVQKLDAQSGGSPKPLDILKLKAEEIEIRSKLKRIQEEIKGYRSLLDIEDNGKLDDKDWLDLERIHEKVLNILSTRIDMDTNIQKLKVQKSAQELKKEQAEGNRVLDFFQIKYADRNNYQPGDQISMGVGIVLPTGHQNRENTVKATIDLQRAENKLREVQLLAKERHKVLESDYFGRYESFAFLKRELESLDIEGKLARLVKLESMDAMSLLNIRMMSLERQLDLIDAERSLMISYLKLIFEGGFSTEQNLHGLLTNKR